MAILVEGGLRQQALKTWSICWRQGDCWCMSWPSGFLPRRFLSLKKAGALRDDVVVGWFGRVFGRIRVDLRLYWLPVTFVAETG